MATKTLTFRRTINTPAGQVYNAFTNATLLREWFCDGAMVQSRVGGRLYCQWNDSTALMGTYTALAPDKKVAFTLRSDDPGDYSTCTITLAEKNGVTTLILTDESDSKEWAKQSSEIEEGWNEKLDNLQSVLETGVDQRLAQLPVLGMSFSEKDKNGEGILVDNTAEGKGARAAGLQKGDVVMSIGNKKAVSWDMIGVALNGHKAGDKVKVAFKRDGKPMNAVITLSPRELPDMPATAELLAEIVARKYTEVNRDLTQAFKGISDERAARRPIPGEWSALHVLAHLIKGERNMHQWMTTLIAAQEPWQDEEEGNLQIRIDSIINGFPTIQALLTELKRNEAETVALLNALPDSFVARKGSFYRLSREMLAWPDHTREHLDQIKNAVRS